MESTLDFINEYDYIKSGMAATENYYSQSSRFVEAVKLFESYIIELTNKKEGK